MKNNLYLHCSHFSIRNFTDKHWFGSVTQSCLAFATPWTAAHQVSLSITNSWSLLKHMSIESVMPSNHLILCRPQLLPPSVFPSIRVFSNESALCIKWPKYWIAASASFLPMNIQDWSPLEWTGWISLQSKGLWRGFSKTTVQNISSSALSFFFTVQLSHPYLTTGKTIALTRHTFVGKVMSLLFNMLSRLVIAFSSKEQASFNFMAAVTICSDFAAPQNKVCHCFYCFPIYLPWSHGTGCHDLVF